MRPERDVAGQDNTDMSTKKELSLHELQNVRGAAQSGFKMSTTSENGDWTEKVTTETEATSASGTKGQAPEAVEALQNLGE